MQNFMIEAHSGIRWLVVLFAIVALFRFGVGLSRGDKFGDLEQKVWTVLNMTVRLQFVLGLIVLILGFVNGVFRVGSVQLAAEHAFTNFIAIAVLEISASRAKKGTDDKQRFRTSIIGVLAAAVLIFLGVARVAGWS